ncbi:hypothetical protein F6X40_23970 [Paraburkholderia sp. UCT31]|uniref:hypothetical protein n=1 Tax=Paraburkholderia sp. UCT31 TaxID=2615209 RepID=UPI0016559FA2|nr:hypothetical protein [Paraburkholderia sp. UCT31]MBC8739774.1 hypothetical protein [Paraburkholderia sp. UCT31]
MQQPVPQFAYNADGSPANLPQRATVLHTAIWEVGGVEPQPDGIARRLIKALEEQGEVAEAFLNLTGKNGKGKTLDDLQEEVVDVFLVMADALFEYIRHLPAVRSEEGMHMRASADAILWTVGEPAAFDDFSARLWVFSRRLLTAQDALVEATNAPEDLDRSDWLGTTLLEAYKMAVRMMHTRIAGGAEQSAGALEHRLLLLLEKKIAKWHRVRNAGPGVPAL